MHAVLPAGWAAARLTAARRVIVTRREGGCAIELPEAARKSLHATVASTLGHFSHAASRRIVLGLWRRHGWLRAVFELSPAADRLWARAEPASVASLVGQARFFRRRFPGFTLVVQRGNRLAVLPARLPVAALHQADSVRIAALSRLLRSLRRMRRPHVLVLQRGYLKTGFKRRVFHSLWWPALQAVTSPSLRP